MHRIDNHTGITIAIVKRPQDWHRMTQTKQYHVPVRHSTSIIQSSWLAWYMPGWYSTQPHSICYVSQMTDLSIMPRHTYLPDEPHHPHAQHLYAILTFDALHELRIPITSRYWRRISIHHITWGVLTRTYDLGALTQVMRRMQTHAPGSSDTYDLSDLCVPITEARITPL